MTEQIDQTFPHPRTCPFAMPTTYTELREEPGPVQAPMATGGKAWLVTRYDQVKAALNDDRLSNNRAHEGYPAPIPIPSEIKLGGSLLVMDAPVHGAYRKLVAGEFTYHKARAMRPRIQAIVDGLVDGIEQAGADGTPVDVHLELGVKTTMSVITQMLGISFADIQYLMERTRVMFGGQSSAEQRRTAVTEMNDYFIDIVKRKHAEPQDDVVSRLMQRWPEPVDYPEAANMTRLLLNGGHDSTASMISLSVLTLLQHPEQLRLLQENPDLAPSAVEELLRYLTVTDITTPRVSVAPVSLGDQEIGVGEGVFPLTGAANRDPAVFDRPEEFDITRRRSDHLTFGHGRHLCLGADIARIELELSLTTLFRRLPDLRLAVPYEEVRFREGGLVFGVHELPVTW